MSIPTEGKPREQDWAVHEGVPHWADEMLPAGEVAHTDYRGHDRRLTRKPSNDLAQRVHVVEPIGAGDRVRVDKTPAGTYEARRA